MSYLYPKVTGETVFVKDPETGKVVLLDTLLIKFWTAITTLQTMVATISSQQEADKYPIGAGCWWWGKSPTGEVGEEDYDPGNIPTGWLIMDGTSLTKTVYPELYSKIGIQFGGEAAGTTFAIPNVIASSRFIRASLKAGTTQIDAIRNIYGYLYRCVADPSTYGSEETKGGRGAMQRVDTGANGFDGGSNKFWSIEFSANKNFGSPTNSYKNPMAGHANGTDIHPYNISSIPIIRVA